jgi:putative SOS response-associated peptidase YedK
MCGRFTLYTKAEALEERFDAQLEMDYTPMYNAAPSQTLPVILNTDPGSIVAAEWGFVPQWADGREGVKPVINARGESVADKPFFRSAFKSNRCLILADGFYEWQRSQKHKVPYRFVLKSGEPFAFAGMWSRIHDATGALRTTFGIITTEANALVSKIHNRMPVILSEQDEADWLNPQLGMDDAKALIAPYATSDMEAYEVSARVNSPRNNTPDLIKPR